MSAEEKEKVQVYTDPDIARAMRIESARRGITQGDLLCEMWSAYKEREAKSKESDIHSAEDQIAEITEITRAQMDAMEKKRREQNEKTLRAIRIKRAKEILEDSDRFDLEMIELYARRMKEIGEEKLSKDLFDLAEFKRRVI